MYMYNKYDKYMSLLERKKKLKDNMLKALDKCYSSYAVLYELKDLKEVEEAIYNLENEAKTTSELLKIAAHLEQKENK